VRCGSILNGEPGASGSGNTFFDGAMDETRIHAGIESSNWVWASWMTVAQNASFQSYSNVVSKVINPVAINYNYNFSAGSLSLSGTGGTANATYWVLGTTNLALPVAQWTVLSTNAFSSSGNFNVSIPVISTNPAEFIRIKQQ
jgi:hypothetical protein